MSDITNVKYRASNGQDFGFDFEFMAGTGWRIYITQQPGYGRRASGAHQTHRYGIGSRPYICWDRKIGTADDAREIAAMWAEATLRYIETGSFDTPQDRPEVRDHGITPFQATGLPTLSTFGGRSPGSGNQATTRRRSLFDRLRGQ